MNINSSSNGLSWTAPIPHFFVCLLLLFLFIYLFLFLFFSLKKSFLLRCVRSNAKVLEKLSLPICIQRVPFFLFFFFCCCCWPCGQKRLNYLRRMRRGSNNRETPKGVPSSKNNRQLVTCRPFRDSCMRTKPNSYRHGSYRLGRVYRQGSKTLFHAYGPWPVATQSLECYVELHSLRFDRPVRTRRLQIQSGR